MIEPQPTLQRVITFHPQIAVIGAGPVGIITALALSRQGVRVLLLESGQDQPNQAAQSLSAAENLRPDNHYPSEITVARRLGGTSNLWGGRCLPYDDLDYRARPWLDLPAWPIEESDLAPYRNRACQLLAAGNAAAYRSPLPGVSADDDFTFDTLERWSNIPRTQNYHRTELRDDPNLLVILGATATGFRYDASGSITAIATHLEFEGEVTIPITDVVLAAGGNESTRLLLSEQRRHPTRFGDQLGRNYMGHLAGCIADIVFENDAFHDGLDFHVDAHGSYVRRRIIPTPNLQKQNRLANIAFWPVVPEIADPTHCSGPLSAVFLALSLAPLGRRLVAEPIRLRHVGEAPFHRLAHIANLFRDPLATLGFAPWFLWKSKFSNPRLPGLFLNNPARRYGLEYHSEHLPSPESRLTLSDTADRLGMPRLAIDFRFSDADAQSILRAHAAIETWLHRNGLARLTYRQPIETRADTILANAKHGNHQIGTIRMAATRNQGVVDRDCRTFDVPNLHVISTAVLPTSGHGNPTMAAVELGLRFADQWVTSQSARPVLTQRTNFSTKAA